ncbi:hypothetical protein GCM10028805_40900 [Spirosoma harenae]
MISTVLKWFFIILSGGVLVVGLTPRLQRWLDQHGFIPNQYNYGDLYNMTNLRAFREESFIAEDDLTEADKPKTHHKDVHLYTIGDSFTTMDTSFYAGERNVHAWIGHEHPPVAPLDTTKKNILVIEFIERVLQERLYAPDYEKIYLEDGLIQPKQFTTSTKQEEKTETSTNKLFTHFAPEINQRLEFILFNGPLFIRFKEVKAQLMLSLFGRVSGAAISQDRKHLFYTPEADTSYVLSSFRHLTDRRIDELVMNLNKIRQRYLHMGFDEVYICMIPNKVTVLDPTYGVYNHQIERIEANPHLEAPIISMIDTLRRHPEWYHLGDGHWNNQGKRFWLQRVNAVVAEWENKPKPQR